ncbi:hypothetical protein B0J17DRAFT_629017 [Rhizoctonia solani]|nr:hypothetical protein B0J17DRAFT_629017 [Rhizoctonia solani]
MASTRQVLIRTDPGDYVQSRILARWGRESTGTSTSIVLALPNLQLPYPNFTLPYVDTLPQSMILTVPYYDDPKDLIPYDDRKALAVYAPTPCGLAVYHRPNSVIIYTGPVDFTKFWVDLHLHLVVSKTYAQQFKSTYLFKEYVHWVELMLSGGIPSLLDPLEYITIDEPVQRPEERASCTMNGLYTLGNLVALTVLLSNVYTELYELGRRRGQQPAFINSSQRDLLRSIQDLTRVPVEVKVGDEDDWPWWATDEDTACSEFLTIILAHITSDPTPIDSLRQTQARVVKRRRGFLRALVDLKSSRNGGGEWDLD